MADEIKKQEIEKDEVEKVIKEEDLEKVSGGSRAIYGGREPLGNKEKKIWIDL